MPPLNGKKEVRILMVGEAGVGKTSLIYSLVSEEFPADGVPPKAEEITIPPDVTPEHVATEIVDYSAVEQGPQELIEEIHRAHVICIVYSVEDDNTIDKITSYWLPLIRDHLGEEHNTPIVLVGNKVDLVQYSSLDIILPIMNLFSEIETCVECSAKTLKNISELFYYAQKAVLHPTAPLYSADERDLTKMCKKALARIFKLCDFDNDGLLNDQELNRFQRLCFNSPLQSQALDDIKGIVKRSIPDGIYDDSITLSGFLFLHTLFIQRGRHETTWTVLRKYGYNQELELRSDYLFPQLDVPEGCTTELTSLGYEFLSQQFKKYDIDNDGFLSTSELQSMFCVCPSIPDWFSSQAFVDNTSETNKEGWLSSKGFLAIWTLMASVDIKATLENLVYLGYVVPPEENVLSAVYVTRDKRIDLEKRETNRGVFTCHVIGPQGAGKSSFMRKFLEKSRVSHLQQILQSKIELANYAVNTIQIYGQEKYLIMREIDIFRFNEKLTEPELMCDVGCFIYDSSDPKSFEYVARTFIQQFSDCKLPILIVAAKSDQVIMLQDYILQPKEFCIKYKLPKPHDFSVVDKSTINSEVFIKLATMAAYPNLRRLVHALVSRPSPNWVSHPLSTLNNMLAMDSRNYMKTGVGIAALAIVGIFIIRLMKNLNSPTVKR